MHQSVFTETASPSTVGHVGSEDAIQQLIRQQFVSTYLHNSNKAQIGLFLSAVVLALIWHGRSTTLWPLGWLTVAGLVTGWRYFATSSYVLATTGQTQATRIAITLGINGVLMAFPLLAFGAYSELERISVSIILMATATASTTTTSGYRSIFHWFAAPMLLTLAAAWALAHHDDASWLNTWGVSALILFYLGFLTTIGRQVAAVFEQSCRYRMGLQESNVRLTAALEEADDSNGQKPGSWPLPATTCASPCTASMSW